MISTAVDSSALIALLSPWHAAHARVFERFDARSPGRLIVPGHALLETYSVLTRLPPPYRISGTAAAEGMARALRAQVRVVTLPATSYWPTIESLARDGVAGGRAYDGAILRTAIEAKAEVLWTLNAQDFRSIAPEGIDIIDLAA